MMRRIGFVAALVGALLFMPGCHSTETCTHPDTGVSIGSYVEALGKVKKNLGEIRAAYDESMGLANPAYVPELREARLGLVDATVTLCDDALTGSQRDAAGPAGGPPVPPADSQPEGGK
jgi:hypothetical protein